MKKLLIYLFIYLSSAGIAQELTVDWGVCYGGSNNYSVSYAIETLPNNNVIVSVLVIGENEAFFNYHGNTDSWVIELNDSGEILQNRCFGGGGDDYFTDIEMFGEYIYFIGQTHSTDGDVQSEPIGGYGNLWVVKTDFDLNIIWERQYGCLGTQDFETAKVTPEGGLILLMDFFNQGGGDVSEYYGASDIWVCEIDANGEILWEKTLGNSIPNHASDVIQNQDGNIVVLGYTYGSGGMIDCQAHGEEDIWVVELDGETQEIVWQNCYGGSDLDASRTIIEDNNNYLIGGLTFSDDGDIQSGLHGEGDAWVFQIDSGGELLWERCFGGTDGESFWNIFNTEDEGYFIFGRTNSRDGDVNNTTCPYPNCYTSTWVVELDSNKEIIWNGTHGSYGHSYHEKNAIKRTGERDFVIAARVPEEGTHLGDVDCEPYPVNNGESAWIYRLYDPSVGIEEYTKRLSLKAYPNPATTQFIFELPAIIKESLLQIKNIFGKTIAEIPIIRGQSQVKWDCSNISSGVYFYQTEIDGINYSGKILIQ